VNLFCFFNHRSFASTDSLTQITLPATVTTIWFYSFYNSDLVEFYLPKLVDTIGYQTFTNCSDLVVFGFETPNNLLTINEWAFSDCPSLVTFLIPYTFDLMTEESITIYAKWLPN